MLLVECAARVRLRMKRHVLLVCLPDRSDAWDELKVCRHPKLSCTFTCKGTQCCCSPDCRPLQASHRLQRSGVRCSLGCPPGGETQCVAPCLMLSAVVQSHSGTSQLKTAKKVQQGCPSLVASCMSTNFFFFFLERSSAGYCRPGGRKCGRRGDRYRHRAGGKRMSLRSLLIFFEAPTFALL